ncbi:MAG: family 78 glycoside hydrolase catalytic domain [Nibricoccus sp.]
MLRCFQFVLLGLALGVASVFGAAARELRVTGLKCEYAVDPAGVDAAQPRLFWRVESTARGQRQTAYQIAVASTAELLNTDKPDLWDSGRVESAQTTQVVYTGKPLSASQRVFWKVRSWDRDGKVTVWSEPATWTMGLLAPTDWKGKWIAAPAATETLLLRKDFTVRTGLRRALAHVTGLGQYEMTLNGTRVGHDLFTPGWTNYDATALYDTYDITSQLKEGQNAVGLNVGNSMYNVVRRNRFAKFTNSFGPLMAIMHLRLEYADGSVDFVGTDQSWQTHAGPNPFASIYGGEDFDARLVQAGWDKPGFAAKGWRPAVPVMQVDTHLRGITGANEPMREIETRQPVGVKAFPDGKVVYDFGQNATFVPRLRISGPAGTSVRLMPAEVVNADGTIFRDTMGKIHRGRSWWQYTKATDAEETWTPQFFFIGSRYVQAEFFLPGSEEPVPADTDKARLPKIEAIESVIVQASAEPVGEFACSNPLLNRIRDLVRWAQRSNLLSVLTDCPHREKLGWIEQFHLNGPAIRYEFDVTRTYAKAMRDLAEAQVHDKDAPDYGLVPNIAPEYVKFKGPFRSAAEWGASFILVPWQQYLFTGDTELLKTHYEAMKRYIAYLETRTKDNVLSDGLGDWYDFDASTGNRPNLTPPAVTATAFLFEDNRTLAKIAGIIGKNEEAKRYAARAEELRTAYNKRNFHADTGTFATNSQASNAIPLAMGIADPGTTDKALASIIADVQARGYATAGDIGFRYLLLALAGADRSDVIYKLINQDEKPGYGYQLKVGATSLTESWNASRSASQNHFMLGQITEWFYRYLVGIDCDPTGPGFSKIIIKPTPVGDLTWAEATYNSVRGPIALRWDRSNGKFTLKVTIPANTTATVFVPTGTDAPAREVIGKDATFGATMLRRTWSGTVFSIESGSYVFESTLP